MKVAIPLIALILGLAVGATVSGLRSAPPEPAASLPGQSSAEADEAATKLTAAFDTERGQLQSRIQELDQAVVDRDRIITKLRSEIRDAPVAANQTDAKPDADRPKARWAEAKPGDKGGDRPRSLAELKERDPEGYARIRERISQFTTRMQDATLNQAQFFETLDQALMTEEQRENHLKLQETLLAVQTTMEALNNGELDNADTWQSRKEMMGTLKQLGPMLEMERAAALNQIGRDLGYEAADEREEFTEYMDHVYEMTSPGTLWRSMMGGKRDKKPAKQPGE